jgi:all-trans-retinol 13,14-reductase
MIPLRNNQEDVLVIGSGIGGLTAAIILLKLGCRVTVVEKNPLPGGLMRSYRRDGIDCPVGVHYMGALAEGQPLRRMFDYLGVAAQIPLERMGSEGVIDRYIFEDFTFDLPEGIDAFAKNLRRTFPGEGRCIDAVIKNLLDISVRMDEFETLLPQSRDFESMMAYMEPLGDLMTRLQCSPALRRTLGIMSSWIGIPPDECPVYYHHMALASYLFSSWRPACSGADMADVFADRVTGLGGAIVAGDPVERILIRHGAVHGAVLESGRDLQAGRVVGAIHPRMLLGMLPAEAVKPVYRRRLSRLEDTQGIFSAYFAVDADAHPELSYNVYRIFAEEKGAMPGGFFYQRRRTGRPGLNLVSVMTISHASEWERWEHTRTGRRGEDYREAKERKAEGLIREAEKIFGPHRGLRLLDASTHLTLRDWVNTPGGSAYGVLRSTKQLIGAAMLNRTSVEGLYLAGQNVLASGVFGTVLGSFYTVRQMIGQARFRKEVIL